MRRWRATFPVLLVCALLLGQRADCYSVLTHEALVDALWDIKMKPEILKRYPGTTPEQLREAHGYAYGGAIIQDMGYYPHGSEFFSDLLHYVRSGDFCGALAREAQNPNEYAFALGALSHYAGDNDGHRTATNPGEPLLYPRLQKKFGNYITYEQSPSGHLKTEFGFDVLEVAKGNFAPEAYHDFIGFNVAVPVLERAFSDTYSLKLSDLMRNLDLAVGSYRHAVSKTIPTATRVAWAQRQDQIQKTNPGVTRRRFQYIIKRSSYEHEWGTTYEPPTAGDRFLAVLLKLIPPIGPLRALKFRMATPQVEDMFMKSFERATAQYIDEQPSSHLVNTNLDTGVPAPPGTYRLNDEAHAKLLKNLAERKFVGLGESVKKELLAFYSDSHAPIATKANPKEWERVQAELEQLKRADAGEPDKIAVALGR